LRRDGRDFVSRCSAASFAAARAMLRGEGPDSAVAFNAIKNRALDLLDRETDLDALAERLTALFLMNPTSARPGRKPPRAKRSLSHQLDYQRRRKKYCF